MIDARKFSFNKLSFPKTTSIKDSILNVSDDKNNVELAVGYFDSVIVSKIITKKEDAFPSNIDNILSSYYKSINEFTIGKISQQNIFAFTNQGVNEIFSENEFAFSSNKLENFWNSSDDVTRYYSLLHINFSDEKDIYILISKLNNIFNAQTEEYKAVFYFSFDYSDIIICAKNLSVKDYTDKIFDLNYFSRCENNNNDLNDFNKYINDSFSLLTFNKNIINEAFENIKKCVDDEKKYDFIKEIIDNLIYRDNTKAKEDELTVSYNIGVKSYKFFNCFWDELNKFEIPFKTYRLLGRHDIAIYNDHNTNLSWLVIVLYFIDRYSTPENENNESQILFNCEPFIRITAFEKQDISFDDNSNLRYNYERVNNCLKGKIDKINNLSKSKKFESSMHINALNSFKDSIVNTLRTGFAEDFVICVYQPFVSFLDYVEARINEDQYKNDEEFSTLFNSFFEIISSLVNSVMHTDRQFIQAPSFNPVFFDIPPKLIAFYTSITEKMVLINKDTQTKKSFSFVFRPNFSHNISVSYYSYAVDPPTDRLLAVSIDEKSFYRPNNVMMVLGHEIAHYIGTNQRSRQARKDYFVKANLFIILKMIFIKYIKETIIINSSREFDNNLSALIKSIIDEVQKNSYYESNDGYSHSLLGLLSFVLQDICFSDNIEIQIEELLYKNINNSNVNIGYVIAKMKNYIKLILEFLTSGFPKNKRFSNYEIIKEFFDFYSDISSVFSEVYADIQMILLLRLSLTDYISTFEKYEKLSINDLIETKSIYYRIFNVVYYFIRTGIWRFDENDREILLLKHLQVSYMYHNNHIVFNSKVTEKIIEDFGFTFQTNNTSEKCRTEKRPDVLESYVNSLMLCYIDDVVCNTHNVFVEEKKLDEIEDLRRIFSIIKQFDKPISLFSTIQKTNEEYLKKLIENN